MSDCKKCVYILDCDPKHKDDTTDCDGFTEADPRSGHIMHTQVHRISLHGEIVRSLNKVVQGVDEYVFGEGGDSTEISGELVVLLELLAQDRVLAGMVERA